MDNVKNLIKREIGIGYCLVFTTIFVVLSNILSPYFDGAYWTDIIKVELPGTQKSDRIK